LSQLQNNLFAQTRRYVQNLSYEYQLDNCGKFFSHALILNDNPGFAKGSFKK